MLCTLQFCIIRLLLLIQIMHIFCSHPLKLKFYTNLNVEHTSEIIYLRIGSLPSYLPLASSHGAQGGRPARPFLGTECESGRSVTSTTTNPYSTGSTATEQQSTPTPHHTASPLHYTPSVPQFQPGHERVRPSPSEHPYCAPQALSHATASVSVTQLSISN